MWKSGTDLHRAFAGSNLRCGRVLLWGGRSHDEPIALAKRGGQVWRSASTSAADSQRSSPFRLFECSLHSPVNDGFYFSLTLSGAHHLLI